MAYAYYGQFLTILIMLLKENALYIPIPIIIMADSAGLGRIIGVSEGLWSMEKLEFSASIFLRVGWPRIGVTAMKNRHFSPLEYTATTLLK